MGDMVRIEEDPVGAGVCPTDLAGFRRNHADTYSMEVVT